MEVSGVAMASLFHEKILLYQELLDALDQERRCIVDMDVDALWKISERKNNIARKIGEVHCGMLKRLDALSIRHDMDPASLDAARIFSLMPEPVKGSLRKAHLKLATLKSDIRSRLAENKRYVGEYLSVLDDLIGLITHAGSPKPGYDRSRYPAKTSAHLFLHREV